MATSPEQPVPARVADVYLRDGPRARVHWPAASGARPALLMFFHLQEAIDEYACRRLAREGGFVVLAVSHPLAADHPYPAVVRDAEATLGWAADHAAELGADPDRLVVAGAGPGAGPAAGVALSARDDGWPPIVRQLLIRPDLHSYGGGPLSGVPPATVVSTRQDDGRLHSARLREAGVPVREIHYDHTPDQPSVLGDLIRVLDQDRAADGKDRDSWR
ncbi:alpha/beta hydrolase [Actinoallomurus sp. CA-142502]|uniref:alpha/beta hydrolase n=1 Tax=Actinoallomurus sp. CA-142502 TaxID=3239885 RepID=UPI003D8DDBA7